MESSSGGPGPARWPRALGALAIALMAAALVYAVTIGIVNFGRIGV